MATDALIRQRELAFLLYELLEAEALCALPRYAEHNRATFDAALEAARDLALGEFAPHNHAADEAEPRVVDGKVRMLPEVKRALDAFSASGFIAACHDFDAGGMQLPFLVAEACFSQFHAANVSTAAYPFLTMAASNLIAAHASAEQQATYLPNMLAGRWFGTMALTEPQAGSSLSDIKTKALEQADGSYRLSGNKIFISAGEHELSENIIHLVLARIEGAPPGVKGISLFIVPRYLLQTDGSLGPANDVTLAGLIHKMGYRGTTSTMLNFGERGGAVAYLLGKSHHGLAYMFHMMNEARIGVGLGAAALGYAGYMHALEYARGRPQGRHPTGKNASSPQVPIVEHADVKRMLLAQKAWSEGALALCFYAARLVDTQRAAEQASAREEAGLLLDLLTPIVKAWPSEYGPAANSLAIQVHGGYGYTREYPVEQLYRDNRLNPIHEGTNGIQALDLLGRKVSMAGGAAFELLLGRMATCVARASGHAEVAEFAEALSAAARRAREITATLSAAMATDANRALANASAYLDMLGHTLVAWLWLEQALCALKGLASGGEADYYRGKLAACQYFFRYELPKTVAQADLLKSMDTTCLGAGADWL